MKMNTYKVVTRDQKSLSAFSLINLFKSMVPISANFLIR